MKMASKLTEIEKEIYLLPVQERARLAKNLLLSLDEEEGDEEEVERLWIEEAKRRSDDYRTGITKGRPAKEFFEELRMKFQ